MPRHRTKVMLIAISIACWSQAAFIGQQTSEAAEIKALQASPRSDSSEGIECNLRLTGPIVTGDLGRLKNAVVGLSQRGIDLTLCPHSLGGSYSEGLSIAQYIFNNSIGTAIQAAARCYSACALIFMAGSEQTDGGIVPNRRLHVAGSLGFHAPFLNGLPEKQYDKQTVEAAYIAGIRAIAGLMKVERRASDEFFPKELLIEMLDQGPDELFGIDTIGKAIKFNITLVGMKGPRTITIPNVSVQMLCNACENVNNLNRGKAGGKCQPESLQSKYTKGEFNLGGDFVTAVDYTFLNFGPETGGQRCKIHGSYKGIGIGAAPTVPYWVVDSVDVDATYFLHQNTKLESISKETQPVPINR
jgi:hypothetical protein